MIGWSDGYVADVNYTHGYYGELNPASALLPFLVAGFIPPPEGVHCELGFGQGLSINLHAAAGGGQWWGTDFNPSQVAFARTLAQAASGNLQLSDQSFEEFCARTDLPDFDSIALHGIWSWISDDNRGVVVDFVRRKLKVGGLLYLSYNALPGWAPFVPMRRLLVEHADSVGAAHGMAKRIDGALDFADQLKAVDAAYLRANPQVPERIKQMREQSRNYLAHEYFNRGWAPMHFSEMDSWLSPAKLSYLCSAHYTDHVPAVNLSAAQQVLLAGIDDPVLKETVRDFCVNQQFRRDYWVKGPRRLPRVECIERLRALRFMLITARESVPYVLACAQGEASLVPEIYGPMLDAMADHAPVALGDLERRLAPHGISLEQIVQGMLLLGGAGHVLRALDDARSERNRGSAARLNRYLLEEARVRTDIHYLASAVTGGGVPVTHLHQLFIRAINGGARAPAAWAQQAGQVLDSLGHGVMRNGVALSGRDQVLAELVERAEDFAAKQLPILRALGVG